MVPNAALKGQMGRLVLTFPKEVEYRFSRVQILPAGGRVAGTYQGSKGIDLAPGLYDLAVSGSRVARVSITPGSETHLLVGGFASRPGGKREWKSGTLWFRRNGVTR